MLSVAVLVVVLSVVNGFERELETRILGILPHLSIYTREPEENNYLFSSQETPTISHPELKFKHSAITGMSAFVQGAALLASSTGKSGTLLTGIDPDDFSMVSEIANYMRTGSLSDLEAGKFGIILGALTARRLDLVLGDQVSVILPDASISPVGIFPRQKRFKVIGIFESRSDLDGRGVYVHIQDASILFRLRGKVQGVYLKLSDIFSAPEVGRSIVNQLAPGSVQVSNWMRTHGNLYHAIRVQKTTMFVLLSFLVTVAAFNLVATLVMVVNERRADVAVFRTLGGSTRMIVLTFVVLGSIIGTIGVCAGVLMGVLLSLLLQDAFLWFEAAFQLNIMSQYFVSYLPVEIQQNDLLLIVLVSLSLCIVSTLYPAWRASQLQPGEILNHE